MVAAAKRVVDDPMVSFEVSSFEDFDSSERFGLIVSATAFHWVDPAVQWDKTARLLQPTGGWLALLTTGERYPESLRSELRELWIKFTGRTIQWTPDAPWVEALRTSRQFGDVIDTRHEHQITLSAAAILGVECTRATFLSFSNDDQEQFRADLQALLAQTPTVDVVQETYLAMAPAVVQE
jgi:trans-aconitate methyltransferase